MLKMSRDRITHLTRLLLEEMQTSTAVKFLKDREAVRQAMLHALTDELKRDEELQTNVRIKIAALKEKERPVEGTREWDALFKRLLDDEYEREGLEPI